MITRLLSHPFQPTGWLIHSLLLLLGLNSFLLQGQSSWGLNGEPSSKEYPNAFQPPQPISFQHISSRDGLPTNSITAFAQDDRGFIWIGSEDGIFRYDGQSFNSQSPGQNNEIQLLPLGKINFITPSSDDFLWIATENNGHIRLDPHSLEMMTFDSKRFPNAGFEFDRARQAVQLKDGTILLGTRAGMYKVIGNDSIQHVWPESKIDEEEFFPVVNRIAEGKDGQIWIATHSGLALYTPEIEGDRPPMELSTIDGRIKALLYEPGSDQLWVGSDLGIVYHLQNGQLKVYEIPRSDEGISFRNTPTGFVRDPKGRLWITSYSEGLYYFDPNLMQIRHYDPASGIPATQINLRTQTIFKDRQGITWIGTTKGIYKYHSDHQYFQHISLPGSLDDYQEGDFLQVLYKDIQGNTWLGSSQSGLLKLDQQRGIHRIDGFDAPIGWFPEVIIGGDNGVLWLGGFMGLHSYDPTSGAFKEIEALRPHFFKEIFDLCMDQEGKIWIALPSEKLYCYDPKTDEVKGFSLKEYPEEIYGCGFNSIDLLNDSTLLVGTQRCGLWTFDLVQEAFHKEIISNQDHVLDLTSPKVHDVVIDEEYIWFSNRINGLAKLEKMRTMGRGISENDRGEPTRGPTMFTIKNGLPSNRILGMLPYKDKNWIFTGHGIASLDIDSWVARPFTHQDGLLETEFICRPIQDPVTKEITALTDNYVVQFHPDSIGGTKVPPPVQLLSLEHFGNLIPYDSLESLGNRFTVPYSSNAITVEFASLDYLANSGILYHYRLKGHHEDWINNRNSRVVRIADLPGGDYQLEVRARNRSGRWNEPKVILSIHVTTPFWKTIWFAALCLVIAVGISYLIYRSRLNRIMAIVDIRSRISRNLHDEIGSSLTSISILSQILMVKHGEEDADSKELLDKISSHAASTMASMDDIIWTINPKNDTGDHLLVRLRQIGGELLEPKGIEAKMEFSEAINDIQFNVDQRWNLTMVYKESLNNAVKYADCEAVACTLKKEGRWIVLTVTDNGIGFDPEAPTHRNGLKNMRERAEALKGKILIRSKPGEGTRIELRFPK